MVRTGCRVAGALTALVLLAQLAPIPSLVEITSSGAAPETRHLVYPWLHVAFAPATLLADWLNGGSRQDIIGFVLWSVVAYVIARLALRGPGRLRETFYAAAFVSGLAVFFVWAIYSPRPIPRLVTEHPDELVWDVHSHTAASHDGRAGFDPAASAAWHARAGFHAAFVTDHNQLTATPPAPGSGALMMAGEELSLSGLHLLVLGTRERIANEPANASWDSTLALVRRLGSDTSLFLVASLPEYWRHHWGEDLADLVMAGVGGFEVWTSSPKAMEIPPAERAHVLARAAAADLPVLGATDMHGIGHTATAWNVMQLQGWRDSSEAALQAAIIGRLRTGHRSNFVLVLDRWLPGTALGRAVAVPVNVALLAGRGSPLHGLALIAWTWLAAVTFRRRPPTP